ncbi:hypothetical protein [Xanthomonas arboricola]|uniref:Uncharacterized protein n=2 Tax=Xanthomonas arboricola pv. pruni TaxID=69929 RepID=A0AAP4KDD8_9XANT|nr:hypothetical protein [Xanthomonas arboricola]MDN0266733.1 hypothetical protein [Xanthomonas arboricola pv. pruni]MDN0272652.1 hypothetical protein [Xanthomonas arboricola pv. pruni]MDN0275328.1 hypothetical protein [Xanthomonas arboricola pv. pruni]MDN0283289.1 hypothetical protein [Xanthomonas arboricola pv. pruni]MDN0289052.1 hypothetical protein [Xanthomonas arboricola pv. pruni]
MGELNLDANSIFNGIVVVVLAAGGSWALGRAWGRLGLLSDRMNLKILRAELGKVVDLQEDPSKTAVFLLTQVLFCLAIMGVGAAYAPLAFFEGGMKWFVVVLAVLGLSIYGCAIYAVGILVRLRKGPAYVHRQEARIAAVEEKLGRTQVGKEKVRD